MQYSQSDPMYLSHLQIVQARVIMDNHRCDSPPRAAQRRRGEMTLHSTAGSHDSHKLHIPPVTEESWSQSFSLWIWINMCLSCTEEEEERGIGEGRGGRENNENEMTVMRITVTPKRTFHKLWKKIDKNRSKMKRRNTHDSKAKYLEGKSYILKSNFLPPIKRGFSM